MSSNSFILPVPPQIPASGLNGTDTKGPAAFKSSPPEESSDSGTSFSATLNQISERQNGRNQEATPSGKPRAGFRDSNTDSTSSQKMSKTADRPHDHLEEVEASLPKEGDSFFYRLSGFALMPFDLMNISIAEDGSLAVEPPSDSTPKSDLSMLTDLIEHLYPQMRQAEGEKLGIGLFEQLQVSISPEATNRAFFDQLAFSAIPQQGAEGMSGNIDRLYALWQGMFTSASTALNGTASAQAELSGINGNGNATLNPLLQMLGISGAGWGINPDASISNGSIMTLGEEGALINGTLFDRLTALSELAQTDISKNVKMAATGESNSETPLEFPARQISENSQPLNIQAALKADAEQPTHPNSVNEGITVKTPEEVLGIKSAVQKSEMLPVHELGSKINLIDGDSKDSGFLFSQEQLPQHLAKLENGAQPSEAASRSLMPQTLNQIVQKAVFSIHDGQHEVQLHLKPDFLGHIRMQIVSEGHQVAIKMVAELPFVKDMLENNLHQLKAELLSQGLDVGGLEVSVAHDSHAERDVHKNAEADKLQAVKNSGDSIDGSLEKPAPTQTGDGGSIGETAIDYFA